LLILHTHIFRPKNVLPPKIDRAPIRPWYQPNRPIKRLLVVESNRVTDLLKVVLAGRNVRST